MISEQTIDEVVEIADQISDRGAPGLKAFAKAFIEAQERVPGGLSIEVGTRNGGSAILFLGLLLELYPAEHRPSLWTIDPYGSKPYDKEQVPIYTDVNYLAMKKLLAQFPNHAHFLMRSHDFFDRMHDLPYWRPGQSTVPVQKTDTGEIRSIPVGEEYRASGLAFALLDGEHDWGTISRELWALLGGGQWMHPRGIAVIDNVDTDPETGRMLAQGRWPVGFIENYPYEAEISPNGQWAIVKRGELK